MYELHSTTISFDGLALSLANGFLLASTGFSFFPLIMGQKLALSKESVLLALELVYSNLWFLSKIQERGLLL